MFSDSGVEHSFMFGSRNSLSLADTPPGQVRFAESTDFSSKFFDFFADASLLLPRRIEETADAQKNKHRARIKSGVLNETPCT